jgi:RNA recognition motif-containing protein
LIGNKGSRQKQSSGHQVYVSNLKYQVNEGDLMDFFKQHNFDPIRARLLYDNDGNSKGFGFVELKTEEESKKAVETLNGEYYQGR